MPIAVHPLNTTPEPEIDPMLAGRIFAAGRWWAAIMARNGYVTHAEVAAHGFEPAEVDAHWSMIVAHGQAVLDFGAAGAPRLVICPSRQIGKSVRRTPDVA